MQVLDTAIVLPEKPYAYAGLSVQGVSPNRLTPRPNENITVPDEVGKEIVLRNLARRFTESRIAIALVGLGLRPAALTVRAHVRALITSAGLALVAANMRAREEVSAETDPTPTAALRFEIPGVLAPTEGYETDQPFTSGDDIEVELG